MKAYKENCTMDGYIGSVHFVPQSRSKSLQTQCN